MNRYIYDFRNLLVNDIENMEKKYLHDLIFKENDTNMMFLLKAKLQAIQEIKDRILSIAEEDSLGA